MMQGATSGQTLERLDQYRCVAVLRRLPGDVLLPVVEALVDGGIRAIEVTMDGERAAEQLANLRERLPAGVLLGAGTVTRVDQVDAAVAAGAAFLVSPHLDPALLERAAAHGVPFIPGVMTPTEIMAALRAGAQMVKVFPASTLGPSYIREIRGPLRDVPIMVTGGVSEHNATAFLEAGANIVGIGSALLPREDVAAKHWQGVRDRAMRVARVLSISP